MQNMNAEYQIDSVVNLSFCVIQILREINFGESRGSETAVLAVFGL